MATPQVPTRRSGALVAVVLTVIAVLAGVALARLLGFGADSAAAPAGQLSASTSGPTIELDLGVVPEPDALASCLVPGFAEDPATVEVLYAVQQRSADSSGPVVLLRNAEGALRLCDVAGPDSPAQHPLPQASVSEPVAFLTNGRAAWDCDGTTVQGYTSTTWLAVDAAVRTVQQRFWVDGEPGPWFTTEAVGGYAHLQTWLEGPVAADTPLAVQHRVLDADGDRIEGSALPTGRRTLPGCSGGDVQIG
jgi:hypothetical protein